MIFSFHFKLKGTIYQSLKIKTQLPTAA